MCIRVLVSICVYICVSWICMYMVVYMYFCVLLVILGIGNYFIVLFISHRFNKADWISLKFIPMWGWYIVIILRYPTFSWLGLWIDMCLYIYIFLRETVTSCNCLVLKFQIDMTWSLLSYFLFIYIFHLEVTCSLCVFHLWYRGKTASVNKNFSNIIWYLNRNNWVVKTVFVVCLLLLGGWPRHESLW